MDGAVRGVLKKAIIVDGVIPGIHAVAKHIEAGKAQMVFLAACTNEPAYKKLMQALCTEKDVPLVEVPDNKALGEWCGLCKLDEDGKPRKVVGAGVACVTDFGEEGQAYEFLMKAIKK